MSKVINSYQTAEYGKFLQLEENTSFPPVSVVRISYPDTTTAFPYNSSAPALSSVEIYPKYAVLTHIVYPEDIQISLSAGDVNINLDTLEELTERQNTILEAITGQIYQIEQYIDDLESNTFDTASACDDTYRELLKLNSNFRTLSTTDFTIHASKTIPVSGNIVATVDTTKGFPITFANSPNFDAFNRMRVSNPLTLFDSSHRYKDNNLWSTLSANGGSVSFNPSQGLMELNVTNTAGASAIRETTKVFSYQPGKSLLVMNTFVMASSATNLRQRVGYFGDQNGIYFQLDDDNISIVKRSLVTGSIVDSVVSRSNWNGDKLDGTGSSGIVLDITKAQIIWTDIEWLGVGTVRVGFCINGQFIVCHSFHHANIIDSTYITTASLPLRYEIINKAATTGGTKTLKQVCSTVISEGGYELRGLQQAVSIPITTPRTFAVAGTFYPIITIRLKTTPDRLDAIVILTALSLLGRGNGIDYNWQVRASGVTTGGSWVDAGVDSAVQYNITGTSYAGGRILASGFLNSSNQGSPNLDILKEALFKFQLERNNLTKTPFELTLVAAADTTNNSGMFASMDWEEISR
jgi:hypothetical protein